MKNKILDKLLGISACLMAGALILLLGYIMGQQDKQRTFRCPDPTVQWRDTCLPKYNKP